MTKREIVELEQDGAEWEALERAMGANPHDLDYPDDMGHASIATTARYASLVSTSQRKRMAKLIERPRAKK